MGRFSRVILVCMAWAWGAPAVFACSKARPAAPLVYERFTDGRRFALVMAESADPYLRFGYRQTNDEQRIRATYSESGLYRADEPGKPLLRLDRRLDAEDVVAFFEEDGSVYLILQDFGEILFYRDGRLLRKLGEEQYREWIHSPWHYLVYTPGSCDGAQPVTVLSDESQRAVTVETIEGSKFRYDARSGQLIASRTSRAHAGGVGFAKRERPRGTTVESLWI